MLATSDKSSLGSSCHPPEYSQPHHFSLNKQHLKHNSTSTTWPHVVGPITGGTTPTVQSELTTMSRHVKDTSPLDHLLFSSGEQLTMLGLISNCWPKLKGAIDSAG